MKNKSYKSNQRKGLRWATRLFLSVFSLVIVILLSGSRAEAQVATYNYSTSIGTYTEITGGTVLFAAGAAYDDNATANQTINSFVYNGTTVTSFSLNTNGWISLGGSATSTTTGYTPLSSSITATSSAGIVAAFGRDQNNTTTSVIRWQYLSGSNETVIQWKNSQPYNTGGNVNYQIRLNHTTNAISFVYGTMSTGTNTTSPQVGIKNGTAAGTIGTTMLNLTLKNIPAGTSCLQWDKAVRGRANTETMLFSSTAPVATVASGTTFTFTPQSGTSTGWVSPVTTFSAVSGITASDATIAWTAPTNANSYNVQFRRAADCAWTNFSGNPVSSATATLSGLVDGTVYHVRVQPLNSTSGRSAGYSHIPSSASGANLDGYVAAGTFTTLALPCSGTPVAGTIPSSSGFCSPSGVVTLTATGFSSGPTGLSQQWEQSSDNVNWSNVTGGTGGTTSSYTTATLSATTYFRFRVSCSASGLSATSNVCTVSLVNCSYDVSGPSATAYTSIMPANGGNGTVFTGWQSTTSGDDNTSTTVSLAGTTFKYRGSTVTGFQACSNGWMTFNTSNTSTAYTNNIAGTSPIQVLAPFWEDLVMTGQNYANRNNSMRYQIDGTLGSGSAVITVEWAGMELFNIPGPNMNFQVKLYEAGDIVEFIYGNFEGFDGTSNAAFSYTVGYNGTSPATASANERFNMATAVTNHWTTTATSNSILPDCFTMFTLTPGTFTGPTSAPSTPVPVNDERSGAISLTVNGAPCTSFCGTYFTSRGATNSSNGQACATTAGNEDDDVFFLFSTTATSDYTIRLRCSPGFDGVLEVLDQNLNSIQCVNATTAGAIETMNITGLNAGGENYYIRVFHNGTGSGTTGQFSLCINEVIPPPVNDDICGAISLPTALTCVPVASIMPNTLSATASPQAACGGSPDDDVWYSWTADVANPTFTVQSGTGYNAHVQIYSSSDNTCSGTLTSLGCFNSTSTGGVEVVNGTNLVLGNTYFIRVYHSLAGAASGLFTVCVTGSTPGCGTLTAPADSANIVANPVSLSWATVANATGYDVYVDQNNPPTTLVSSNQSALTYDYVPSTATAGQTYFWMVVPRNALGASSAAPCTVRRFTLAAPACPVLTSPANGFSSTSGAETLNWTASTGATGYDVLIDNNPVPATIVSTNQAGISFGPYTTSPANTYYWVANAIGAYGTSSGCAAFSFNTNPPSCVSAPTSPTDAGFICSDNGSVTLTWPSSPGSTGYDVVLDGVTVSSAQAGTTYTSGVLSYGSHTWSVIPQNSNGPAAGCSTWTFDLRQKPSASASSNAGCLGLDLNLNGTTDIGTAYSWTGPNGFTSNQEDPTITALTSAMAGNYEFTASLNGCSTSATVSVAVNPIPVIAAVTATPAAVCVGQTTQLDVALPGPVYCIPGQSSGSCGSGDEYIANVNFGSGLINQASTCAQSLPAGYTNYTSVSANVSAGTTYPISVSNPNYFSGDQCRVWVDWNRNGVFTDAGETFTLTGTTTFTGSVVVPAGALNGNTRMRVQLLYNSTPTPCNTSGYSESEDYTLVVSGGVAPSASGNFSWDNAGTLSDPSVANPIASPITATTYTVTLTSNGCSAQSSVSVAVNELPTAAVSGGGTVCSIDPLPGVTFTFTGTAPYTFTYSGPGGTTVSGHNNATYTINSAAAGNYAITSLTDNNGCASANLGGIATVVVNAATPWYADSDGDGYGNPAASVLACDAPTGYVVNNTDCDDANNAISPIAQELCNGIDDDCSGTADDNLLPLSAPASVAGNKTACVPGVAGSASFTVTPVPAATSYLWSVPAGFTIVSGQGTSSITVSWTLAAIQTGISGNLCVTASNACQSSVAFCEQVSYQSAAPVTPNSISGNGKVCPGDLVTYSVAAVARATSYNWTVPSGMTISSGQGTNVISVQVNAGYIGGTMTVASSNVCGTSSVRSKAMTVNNPITPGVITGGKDGLCNTIGNVFSIAPVSNATSYSWTSTNSTVASGNGTTTVSVNVGVISGTGVITVRSVNGCGISLARTLSFTSAPARPGIISGTTTPCSGATEAYSVSTVAGADLYNWAVTSNGAVASGQGTKNITINWFATGTSQATNVAASNACGTSLTRSLSGITVSTCPRVSDASGALQMVVMPNPASSFANVQFTADKTGDYRLRLTDISGRVVFVQDANAGVGQNIVSLDLSAYASGMYTLQLDFNGEQQISRLILE